MHVIEQFLRSKNGNPDGGDDRIVVTDHFAAVLDGSTSKSDLIDPDVATQITQELIENLPPGAKFQKLVGRVTERLHSVFEEHGLLGLISEAPRHRSSTTLAAYSRARREIWLVGDSQARFWGEVYSEDKEIDRITAELRTLWLTLESLAGTSVEEMVEEGLGRKFIMPLLQQQNRLRALPPEHPWSFGALDGYPVAEEHLKVIPVPKSVREVVLATDGYPVILDTLAETEVRLMEALEEDPLCVDQLRGTKPVQPGAESFDDRAYLRLDVFD